MDCVGRSIRLCGLILGRPRDLRMRCGLVVESGGRRLGRRRRLFGRLVGSDRRCILVASVYYSMMHERYVLDDFTQGRTDCTHEKSHLINFVFDWQMNFKLTLHRVRGNQDQK